MKVVVKIGTQSILSTQGAPIEKLIRAVVEQIVSAQQKGHKIVLVSSGAVGFGRNMARQVLGKEYGVSIGEKQVLASLGQHELINLYSRMFRDHGKLTSQLLLTKQDFYTRKHCLNISRLMTELLDHENIIPVVNENDSVAIKELMFRDNDELAGLIAAQIGADKLIILSNVEGVYRGHPQEPGAELMTTIDPQKGWPCISSGKSTHGRGGMISKISTAQKISKLGIETHIASINHQGVILKLITGEHVGTKVLAFPKKSSIKRWIAYSHASGKIFVNAYLHEALRENRRVMSILPVGIETYSGNFAKGDVVEIFNPDNERIGMGVAKYKASLLGEFMGQKNKPAFIHYDYLYIF